MMPHCLEVHINLRNNCRSGYSRGTAMMPHTWSQRVPTKRQIAPWLRPSWFMAHGKGVLLAEEASMKDAPGELEIRLYVFLSQSLSGVLAK